MAIVTSNSPEETQAIGAAWGRSARSGWVLALQGDLGVGKTQLVRGLAVGLECPARVHSPTFALLHIYEGGRLLLHHLDLYRLNTLEDIEQAGLLEYLWQPEGVTVVEWADRWLGEQLPCPDAALLPTGGLRCVRMQTLENGSRRMSYEDFGH